MTGYYERDYDEDGNPEGVSYVKEEPDCGTCCDSGTIRCERPGPCIDCHGEGVMNCPDCNPTPEQHAAHLAEAERINAEWRAAVERGEISAEDPPF